MKKIFIAILLLFFCGQYAFADTQVLLNTDKNSSDINDYINVEIKVMTNDEGNINIDKIDGIENFNIISQSQSQSSSSQIVVLNGKTQSKTSLNFDINLKLQPKNKGEFVLGPANLIVGTGTIKSNTQKIIISGDKIFLNPQSNNLKVKNQNTNNNDFLITNQTQNNENIFLNIVYVLIILVIIGIIFIVLKISLKKYYQTDTQLQKNTDFESIDSIIYPEITDIDFYNKVDLIFREKLSKKYKINNITNKTYDEILEKIQETDKTKIKEIIILLIKAKYSNIITDNNTLLNQIKEF